MKNILFLLAWVFVSISMVTIGFLFHNGLGWLSCVTGVFLILILLSVMPARTSQSRRQTQPAEYLITRANAMYQLLSKSDPTAHDLAVAASLGYHTLCILVDNTKFRDDVEYLSQQWVTHRHAVRDVLEDMDHFNSFLEGEKVLMIKQGVNPQLLNESIRLGTNVVDANRWQGDIIRIFAILTEARDKARNLANSPEQKVEQIRHNGERKRQRKTTLLSITYVLVGGAFIAVNAAASVTLTPVVAALSDGLGGALLSQAIPTAKDIASTLSSEKENFRRSTVEFLHRAVD